MYLVFFLVSVERKHALFTSTNTNRFRNFSRVVHNRSLFCLHVCYVACVSYSLLLSAPRKNSGAASLKVLLGYSQTMLNNFKQLLDNVPAANQFNLSTQLKHPVYLASFFSC